MYIANTVAGRSTNVIVARARCATCSMVVCIFVYYIKLKMLDVGVLFSFCNTLYLINCAWSWRSSFAVLHFLVSAPHLVLSRVHPSC